MLEFLIQFIKKLFSKNLAEIILLLVIPFLTLGFNFFESTFVYQNIIGIKGIGYAINIKLQGVSYDSAFQQFMVSPSDKEFYNIWKMIRNNSSASLPKNFVPKYISVVGPNQMPYVNFVGKNFYLVTESVPVVVLDCDLTLGVTFEKSDCQINKNAYYVGTLQDIKSWTQETKDRWRTVFNSIFACISILFGFILISKKARVD